MEKKERIGRRRFLKTSAAGLTAASALSSALSGCANGPAATERAPLPTPQAGRQPPSERLAIAVIGTGGLGRGHHLNHLLNNDWWKAHADVLAVCDVDLNRATEAAQDCLKASGRRVGIYQDYRRVCDRKDIDAVFIVTPDHWHSIIAIAAMEAGKDIYCEKPLTLTVEEGKRLVATARRYGTVFQTGSQQRSDPTFRKACELVRDGKIGRIKRIDTVLHAVGNNKWIAAHTPPPNLDWDFYQGQAPWTGYRHNCVHYQFRWLYDYSGGVMTDWGAHHNDIAQWGLGTDGSGPVWVDGTRAKWHLDGPYTVPSNFDVQYKYADGTELWCHTDNQKYDDGTEFGNGIKFTGEKGWVFVCRGGRLEASFPEPKNVETKVKLYASDDHHRNWYDCVKSRKRCICDVEIGHRSVTICHIGNISMRLGRPLQWDPVKEEFIGDPVANQMLSRSMRAPWRL